MNTFSLTYKTAKTGVETRLDTTLEDAAQMIARFTKSEGEKPAVSDSDAGALFIWTNEAGIATAGIFVAETTVSDLRAAYKPEDELEICYRCGGSGTYVWGTILNGVPQNSGVCFRCQGAGKVHPKVNERGERGRGEYAAAMMISDMGGQTDEEYRAEMEDLRRAENRNEEIQFGDSAPGSRARVELCDRCNAELRGDESTTFSVCYGIDYATALRINCNWIDETPVSPRISDWDLVAHGRVAEKIADGTYTVELVDGGHFTFKIQTQELDADFAPGKTVASYLSGSDNESSFSSFAFVNPNGTLTLWKKHRETARELKMKGHVEMQRQEQSRLFAAALMLFIRRHFLTISGTGAPTF